MARSNQQVKEDILAQLAWDTRVDASKITVKVDDGVAILGGSVPNQGAATAALADAWSVTGITSVEDRLAVEHPESLAVPSDTELQSNAINIITWDPELEVSDLEAGVERGHMTLRGTVDAAWKKEKVGSLVRNLTGVVTLQNELTVVPTDTIADQAIAEDLMAALDRNAFVDASRVEITVENGRAHLGGRVDDWKQRRTAYETALYTMGVREVKNDLVVAADPQSVARSS